MNSISPSKAKNRMIEVKATMQTMSNQISQQAAMLKVAGTMSKNAELMKTLNSVMSSKKVSSGMHVLAREMMKAGVVEEVFEEAFDTDELEEEANYEVNNVIMELLPDMPNAPWNSIPDPSSMPAGEAASSPVPVLETPSLPVGAGTSERASRDSEMDALQARAGAL